MVPLLKCAWETPPSVECTLGLQVLRVYAFSRNLGAAMKPTSQAWPGALSSDPVDYPFLTYNRNGQL